jgi:hypothetical protein
MDIESRAEATVRMRMELIISDSQPLSRSVN